MNIKTKLEYIWIDSKGTLRGKTRIIRFIPNMKIEHIENWNYDGSSTGQAVGSDSEIILKPQKIVPDPFRKDTDYSKNNKIVFCDIYSSNGTPHITNTRYSASVLFNKYKILEPLYGIEQEFFIVKDGYPIGMPYNRSLLPKEQGDYYCGVGGDTMSGRHLIELVLDNCLYTGLDITGLNAEVAPSEWEFPVCAKGRDASDQLYLLRYILNRTAENMGFSIDYSPKPLKGNRNGSGCHTNFSTKNMREKGGYKKIVEAIKKFEKKHNYHMEKYGENNRERMSGRFETANYENFSFGVADRGASIRIPRESDKNGCGYFEDRRPGSNMDPYVVTSLILETITN